jgi:DNA polymerase III sliding clamp (beta) subunit (PCNA family)
MDRANVLDRAQLLRTLDKVSPALSIYPLIPVLQHFWFTGKEVMAYNDAIAISTPLATEFKGAVPGTVLMEILRTITADMVTLEVEEEIFHIKVGKRGDYKLGLLPTSSFEPLFTMPPFKSDGTIGSSREQFLNGIKNCNRSVSIDTSVPEQLGVTVIGSDKGLDLYATNNTTLAHSKVPLQEVTKFKRVILSGPFCKQVIELSEKAKVTDFFIDSTHSMLRADNTILFGKLVETHTNVEELDFKAILKHHLPDDYRRDLWDAHRIERAKPGPDGEKYQNSTRLNQIIERAYIISNATINKTRTKVTLNGSDQLRFYSKSDRGEARDDLDLFNRGGKQGEVEIHLDPGLIRLGMDAYQKILFTDACVILTDADNKHLYLVGATNR